MQQTTKKNKNKNIEENFTAIIAKVWSRDGISTNNISEFLSIVDLLV